MIILGIDIGMTGAIARVDSVTGQCDILDLPTMLAEENNSMKRMRLSGYGLAQIVLDWSEPGARAHVFFENVQARPNGHRESGAVHGNSMQSQGGLMRSRGIVESALECMRCVIHPVHPQTWKNFYHLGGAAKDASRGMAVRLYPAAASLLARKKDINRAEALLIAHYGLLQINGPVHSAQPHKEAAEEPVPF